MQGHNARIQTLAKQRQYQFPFSTPDQYEHKLLVDRPRLKCPSMAMTKLGSFFGQLTKELREKVTELEGQIQNLKDQKASWDEKMKELERERDEARTEAFVAVEETSLANGEHKSLKDYVKELVKEMPDDRGPSDGARHQVYRGNKR
ncbi:hypothetical protein AgCh_016546 [Apium graveolens]